MKYIVQAEVAPEVGTQIEEQMEKVQGFQVDPIIRTVVRLK